MPKFIQPSGIVATLRAELDTLKKQFEEWDDGDFQKDNAALRARVAELEAALEKIARDDACDHQDEARATLENGPSVHWEIVHAICEAIAAEREACAKVAEGDDEPWDRSDGTSPEFWGGRSAAAAAIRARKA